MHTRKGFAQFLAPFALNRSQQSLVSDRHESVRAAGGGCACFRAKVVVAELSSPSNRTCAILSRELFGNQW